MLREPKEEWQEELENTAGYQKRLELMNRSFESKKDEDYNEWMRWQHGVVWPAELAVWKKAGDWYLRQLAAMSPRRRASLSKVEVRCEQNGCLLGTGYRIPLQDGGERVFFTGRTASGRPKYGICNWAFADSFDGLQRWWQVGCKHGHFKIGTEDVNEAVYGELGRMANPDVPAELKVAWRSGVYHPPRDRWERRAAGRQGDRLPPATA